MGREEGTCWDEHWVLYGNQFGNKLYLKKNQASKPRRHKVVGKNQEKSGNKMGREALEVTGAGGVGGKGLVKGAVAGGGGGRGKCWVAVMMGSRSKEGLSLV